MKPRSIFLGCLIMSLLIAACVKDTDFPVEKPSTKLVMYGFTATEQPFQLFISKSRFILDPTGNDRDSGIADATVRLYADGLLVDQFAYSGPYSFYTSQHGTVAQAGIRYKIVAEAPGVKDIEAEAFLPADFPGLPGTTMARQVKKVDGEWLDEVRLRLDDPAGVANFYALRILTPFYNGSDVSYHSGSGCMYTNDPDVDNNSFGPFGSECMWNELFMSDKNFNGRRKELILYLPVDKLASVQDSSGRVYRPLVEINNITQEYYKHRRSIEQYENSVDNPFAEPVTVFTNVQNGLGIFGITHIQKDTIR